MEYIIVLLIVVCGVLGMVQLRTMRRMRAIERVHQAALVEWASLPQGAIPNEDLMILLHDIMHLLYDDHNAQLVINTERALLTAHNRVYVITADGIHETSEWVVLHGKPTPAWQY